MEQPTSPGTLRRQLFFTSLAILLFELACIRWIPAQVRYLSYFMNFILLASFLGIGAGILAGRRSGLRLPPFALFLLVLVVAVSLTRFDLPVTTTQVLFYGAVEGYAQNESYLAVPLLFALVALAFVPLARPLSRLFTSLPPLQAYAIDIAGSLTGIALFFVMSLLSLPPVVWFSVLGLALIPTMAWRSWMRSLPFLAAAVLIVFQFGRASLWSPYYRLDVHDIEPDWHVISLNTLAQQEAKPAVLRETFYFRPHDVLGRPPFKRVLVIGAGLGADVGVALKNGAEYVDAVEIDPVIAQLGGSLDPEHAYQDPRVHVTVNDGRAFLRNTDQRYDLIVFALTDSLTLTSAFSNLRLESFLLTQDSMASAREHLSDNGLLVLYNYYREEWLVNKLAGMLSSVFGEPPYVTTYGDWGRAAVFMAGPRLQELGAADSGPYPGASAALAGSGQPMPVIGYGRYAGEPAATPATDDWPFIYMQQAALPPIYLLGLATVAVIAALLLRLAAPLSVLSRFSWHFFFLGAAFMLLETQSLVTFALLLGTTWLVNSLVFFAILLSVLAAILVNARFKALSSKPLYVCLFAALLVAFVVQPSALLGIEAPALRYGLAALIAFLPVFLANVVFSHSFRDAEAADVAFASNLIGAMVGGMLEYAALVTGYHALTLVIALCYLLSVLLRNSEGWRRPRIAV
jgi:hypothetical protein